MTAQAWSFEETNYPKGKHYTPSLGCDSAFRKGNTEEEEKPAISGTRAFQCQVFDAMGMANFENLRESGSDPLITTTMICFGVGERRCFA